MPVFKDARKNLSANTITANSVTTASLSQPLALTQTSLTSTTFVAATGAVTGASVTATGAVQGATVIGTTSATAPKFLGPVVLPTYTTVTLPNVAASVGMLVRCSDGDAGGACLALSNGTHWLRISLGAAVADH